MKATKKILAVVMACIMLFGILPASIFAEDYIDSSTTLYGVYVAGQKVTSEPYQKASYWLNDGEGGITSEGASADNYNVKFVPESGSIYHVTLKNANLSKGLKRGTTTYLYSYVIWCKDTVKLKITLEGNNTIELKSNFAGTGQYHHSYSVYGIWGGYEITGDGSLEIKGDAEKVVSKDKAVSKVGIYSYNSNNTTGTALTITDNVKLKIATKQYGADGNVIDSATSIYAKALYITGKADVTTNGAITGVSNIAGDAKVVLDNGSMTLGKGKIGGNANVTVKNGAINSSKGSINANAKVVVNNNNGLALTGSELVFNGGTLEATGSAGVGKITIGEGVEAKVKVNTEATAEGAKLWNERDEFTTFKYAKLELYGEPVATLRKIGRVFLTILKVLIAIPMSFLDILGIIGRNFVEMIQEYITDWRI